MSEGPTTPPEWPAELLAPATVGETTSGVYAVHESAHATVAADVGFTVEYIDITRTATEAEIAARGWTMVTSITEDLHDEPGAVVRAAARPAVTLYMHLLGIEGRNPWVVDEGCRHDDDLLRRMCRHEPELESWVRGTAERWVVAAWPRILHLAEAIVDARGRLEYPDIPTPLDRHEVAEEEGE